MKTFNFWRTLFFSALAVVAFAACGDDDNNDGGGANSEASITVDGKDNIAVGLKSEVGDSKTVSVVSSNAWTLAFDAAQSWVEADVISGGAGTSSVKFTVKETLPAGEKERTTVATLTTKGVIAGIEYSKSAKVTIRQSESGSSVAETNVAEIRALLVAMNPTKEKVAVTEELAAMTVTGIIVSDYAGSNIGNEFTAAIQDTGNEKNSGLLISYNELPTLKLAPGTVITASLANAKVSTFYDAIQLALDDVAQVTTVPGTAPEAIIVTPDQLMEYEAQFVRINECQPAQGIIGKTWTEVWNTAILTTRDGKTFGISTGKNAVYKTEKVPDKSGYVQGISQRYFDSPQIKPRVSSDIVLDQPMFEITGDEVTIGDLGEGVYKVNATIVGVHQKGVMFGDKTGYVLAFNNDWKTQTANPYIGDVDKMATIDGTVAARYGLLQFSAFTIEVGAESSFQLPAPEVFDAAAIDKYAADIKADEANAAYKYVKVSGTLNIEKGANFNTYTIAVPNWNNTVAFAYGLDSYFTGYETGDVVDAEGFALGYDTSNNKLNILLRKISKNTTIPSVTFTSEPTTFAAASPVAQTLNYTSANISGNLTFEITEGANFFEVTGSTATTVTVNAKGNNTTDAALTGKLVAEYNGTVLATVDLEQERAASANDKVITVTFDTKAQIEAAGLPYAFANGFTGEKQFTVDGNTYTANATSKSYGIDVSVAGHKKDAALFIGKKNSYIQFPAIEGYKLVSVEIVCGEAMANSNILNITDAAGVAHSTQFGPTVSGDKGTTHKFDLTDTQANTAYRLELLADKNFQTNGWTLTYTK